MKNKRMNIYLLLGIILNTIFLISKAFFKLPAFFAVLIHGVALILLITGLFLAGRENEAKKIDDCVDSK